MISKDKFHKIIKIIIVTKYLIAEISICRLTYFILYKPE